MDYDAPRPLRVLRPGLLARNAPLPQLGAFIGAQDDSPAFAADARSLGGVLVLPIPCPCPFRVVQIPGLNGEGPFLILQRRICRPNFESGVNFEGCYPFPINGLDILAGHTNTVWGKFTFNSEIGGFGTEEVVGYCPGCHGPAVVYLRRGISCPFVVVTGGQIGDGGRVDNIPAKRALQQCIPDLYPSNFVSRGDKPMRASRLALSGYSRHSYTVRAGQFTTVITWHRI
jgi:hypothetical protein